MADWKNKDWLEKKYVEEKKSTKEIADIVGANGGTVYYYLDKFNIDTRSLSESKRKERARFSHKDSGHEAWRSDNSDGTQDIMFVHRLAAIAWFGIDSVRGSEIHHKNGVPWDNRECNLKPLSPSEHGTEHWADDMPDPWKGKDRSYDDKEALEELYVKRGLTAKEVSEHFDCGKTTILRYLDKYNIDKDEPIAEPPSGDDHWMKQSN